MWVRCVKGSLLHGGKEYVGDIVGEESLARDALRE